MNVNVFKLITNFMAKKKTEKTPEKCTACDGAALINNGTKYCPRCEGTAIEPDNG